MFNTPTRSNIDNAPQQIVYQTLYNADGCELNEFTLQEGQPLLSADGKPLEHPAAAFKNVGTLLPGETRTLTFSLTSGNLAGTRHLRAFVDSLGRVQEWSDGDNQLSTTYHLNPIALSIGSTEQGTELSWNSFWGQRYTLYRCTDLAKGFLLYKSNLEATPPVNRHVDAEDNPVRFYKLVVIQP